MATTVPSWLVPCPGRDLYAPSPVDEDNGWSGRVVHVTESMSKDVTLPLTPVEQYVLGGLLHCGPWTPQFFNPHRSPHVAEQLGRLHALTGEGQGWWIGDDLVGVMIRRFRAAANQEFLRMLASGHVGPSLRELFLPPAMWMGELPRDLRYEHYRVADEVAAIPMDEDLLAVCQFLESAQLPTRPTQVAFRAGRWPLNEWSNPPLVLRMLLARYRVVGMYYTPLYEFPLGVLAHDRR